MNSLQQCEQTQEALPWFVNRTLSGEQRLQVQNHLQVCGECAAEAAWLQALQDEMSATAQESEARKAPESAGGFSVLKERIRLQRSRKDRRQLLIAASALLAVATVIGSVLTSYLLEPKYRTVTDVSEPAPQLLHVEVYFDPDARLETLRSLVSETGAIISQGPQADGRVLMEIPVREGQSAAEVLRLLRGNPDLLRVNQLQESRVEEKILEEPGSGSGQGDGTGKGPANSGEVR